MASLPPLLICTFHDLEETYLWLCDNRKSYADNSEIWHFRSSWDDIKEEILRELNEGTYTFSSLDRYDINGMLLSIWQSKDMLVLKLLSNVLYEKMRSHLSPHCVHVKGNGGLKKGVEVTSKAIFQNKWVMRSDIQRDFESISFYKLMELYLLTFII